MMYLYWNIYIANFSIVIYVIFIFHTRNIYISECRVIDIFLVLLSDAADVLKVAYWCGVSKFSCLLFTQERTFTHNCTQYSKHSRIPNKIFLFFRFNWRNLERRIIVFSQIVHLSFLFASRCRNIYVTNTRFAYICFLKFEKYYANAFIN